MKTLAIIIKREGKDNDPNAIDERRRWVYSRLDDSVSRSRVHIQGSRSRSQRTTRIKPKNKEEEVKHEGQRSGQRTTGEKRGERKVAAVFS